MKNNIQKKVRSTSRAVFAGILLFAAVLAVVFGYQITAAGRRYQALGPGSEERLVFGREVTALVTFGALLCLLVYVAFIFWEIAKNETPFVKTIPKRLKIASVFLFLSVALPQWAGYVIESAETGAVSFTLLDERTLLALVLAGVVFCLAQIFAYGWMIQDENYEIL